VHAIGNTRIGRSSRHFAVGVETEFSVGPGAQDRAEGFPAAGTWPAVFAAFEFADVGLVQALVDPVRVPQVGIDRLGQLLPGHRLSRTGR
jgi:hypothetical protein